MSSFRSEHHTQSLGSAKPTESKRVRLAYGLETFQFGELHTPQQPGPYPTAILIHGGWWRARTSFDLMTGLAKNLAQRGIAAWNIEFRRVGDTGGGWPTTLLDVARATDYLRALAPTHAIDLQRVITLGFSSGGHLALWLAARPRFAADTLLAETSTFVTGNGEAALKVIAAVSLAGVTDLEMGWRLNLGKSAVADLLGGSPEDVPERYAIASPTALLPLGIPQVIVHGTKDDKVPLHMSQAYAAAAKAAGDTVTFVELAEADHFALIDPHSTAWASSAEIVQDLLGLS